MDLRGGSVVRLRQGQYDQETRYSDKPREVAQGFAQAGAERIHVVDLDGAREGMPTQRDVITALVQELQVKFEVGGGIRHPETIEFYLGEGCHRVIVGTRAYLDEGFLREILGAFGEKVIIGVDAHEGKIATQGWTRISDISVMTVCDSVLKYGGKEIVYTDIAKDGMLEGPNMEAIKLLLSNTPLGVIASGGVSSLDNIKELKRLKDGNLLGAIVGKADTPETVRDSGFGLSS